VTPLQFLASSNICTVNHRPLVGLCLDSNEDRGTIEHLALYTSKAACINFVMWGRVLDVINHAKFQLKSVQGFRSPRWPKIAISHWLEVSPLQQRTQ